MICSTLTEKLDNELFSTITLFTVFQTFPAGLNVTSRWPDTSDFHSPISALVPRPKFMTPSWPGEGMARLPAAVRENEPALIPPRSLPLFGKDQRPDAWGGGGNRAYNQISFQIRVVFPPSLSGSMFNRTWQVQCDWISRGKECWSWVSRRSVCGEGENTTPLKTPACSGRLIKTMAGEIG